MSTSMTVALAGNPNSGKTTIFNNLTGAKQHVGNYPGVTVERREGRCHYHGQDMLMVDMPGTYSLTAQSLDELVARNVIINEKPDLIVNILDASNLERNLYLTIQLLELERPVILGLNMTDVAATRGLTIHDQKLEQALGVSVVRMIGNRNQGTEQLLAAVAGEGVVEREEKTFRLHYGDFIEGKIETVMAAIRSMENLKYPVRWLAIKLLEHDKEVCTAIHSFAGYEEAERVAEVARAELVAEFNEETDLIFAQARYAYAGQVYMQAVESSAILATTQSDRIDKLLTHRVLGVPIFFGIMWLLFNVVFTIGTYPQDWIADGMTALGNFVGNHMADGQLKSLLVDGIIGGVGSVLSFVPLILLLFLGISLLEDTGYMARAAFVVDRVMRAVGLHGKSFIPLLLGFGCSVPAIMGTRTLENPRDRMVTILVAPLISCSARLPVYTLLIGAFFSAQIAGTVLFSIYFLGILMAILMSFLFRKALFPGEQEAFVMEMPPYHMPTLRSVLAHMWERGVLYVKKAGTYILAASILVWFATTYPQDVNYSQDFDQAKAAVEATFQQEVAEKVLAPMQIAAVEDNKDLEAMTQQIAALDEEEDMTEADRTDKLAEIEQVNPTVYPFALKYAEAEKAQKDELEDLKIKEASEKLEQSYAGQLGRTIEPVLQPLGFDWKIGISLIAAVTAKEVMVSTLATIYSVGDVDEDNPTNLRDALAADPAFSPLVAYCLMIFTLLYIPCIASLAVLKRETNSWKWTGFAFLYTTVLAWIVSFVVYQVGSLFLT